MFNTRENKMTATFKTALSAAAISIAALAADAMPTGFIDDMDAAKAEAATSGRYILADFSGSDWCGWCQRLDKEVFATPEFLAGATNKFVLVMIDSPRDKSILSDHARKANPGLVDKYRVDGYPTVLILDADGKVLDQTGYRRGGPKAYLEMLDKLLEEIRLSKSYESRIAALPKGSLARAKILDEFLMKLDLQAQMRHEELVDEVLAADPDGKAGLRRHYGYFTCSRQAEEFLRTFQRDVGNAVDKAYKSMTTRAAYRAMSKKQRAELDAKVMAKVSRDDYPALLAKGEAGVARLRKLDVPADAKEHFDSVVTAIDDVVQNIRGAIARNKASESK